jgi:hypothetical protein
MSKKMTKTVKELEQKNVRLPFNNKKELEAYIKLTAPEMHIIKNLAKKE